MVRDMEKKNDIRVFKSILEMVPVIWPTPLVRVGYLSKDGHEVWAKLEYFNPFSRSIKDRPAWAMLMEKIEECRECEALYEATSGNVGIAIGILTSALGLKYRAYLPKNVPETTEVILKVLGAEVIKTDYETISKDMVDYVVNEAKKAGAINLNQFENDTNFQTHYKYTAKEIDEQVKSISEKPPKAIIAGVGTSGHIAAIAKYFKEKYGDETSIVGVVPKKGDSIPGIKRLETGPKWINMVKVDKVLEISKKEAISNVLEVARNEGLLIGLSAGAVTAAFKIIREELGKGLYVLVYPDDIFKYLPIIKEYFSQIKQ